MSTLHQQSHTTFPPLPVTEDGKLICGKIIQLTRGGEGYEYQSCPSGWMILSGPWCLGCGRQICVCPPPTS